MVQSIPERQAQTSISHMSMSGSFIIASGLLAFHHPALGMNGYYLLTFHPLLIPDLLQIIDFSSTEKLRRN